MTILDMTHRKKKQDAPRCAKTGVYRPHDPWQRDSRCHKNALPGSDFCAVHQPEAEKKRADAARARWIEGRKKQGLGWWGSAMLNALEKIAAGDNDPRATAQAAVDQVRGHIDRLR